MSIKEKIQNDAEEITYLAAQAKVLSQIIIEDESTPMKCHTLTGFSDSILDKITELSESIIKSSFELKD